MARRRVRGAAVLAIALGLVLSACAPAGTSDGGSGASASATGTAERPSATEDPATALSALRDGWEAKAASDASGSGRSIASIAAGLLTSLSERLDRAPTLTPADPVLEPSVALGFAQEIDRRATAGLDPTTGGVFTQGGSDSIAGVPDPVPLESAEGILQAFTGTPDAAGSYLPAAAKMAAEVGVELAQYDATTGRECGEEGDALPDITWFAIGCGSYPSAWINRSSAPYADWVLDPGVLAVTRHEIAHHLLWMRCLTPLDFADDANYEAVTSSFAVLFLGADREALQIGAGDKTNYLMSDATDALARELHERPIRTMEECSALR